MIIIIIDFVTVIHLCPHPPLILIGDSQSFQKSPLDGNVSTHFQIPAEVSDKGDIFWDGSGNSKHT